jgi:hypothetical protein
MLITGVTAINGDPSYGKIGSQECVGGTCKVL